MPKGTGRHACVAALPTLLLLLLLAPSLASASDPKQGPSASLSVGSDGSMTWKKNGTFPLPYGVSVTTPNISDPGQAALVELKAAIDAYAALLASDAAALETAKINHDAKAGIRLALTSHASGYAAAKARAKAAVAAALANAVPGARCPNGTVAVPVELKKVLAAKAPEVTVSVVVGSNKTSLLARAAAGLASAKAALLNETATNSIPTVPGRRRTRSLSSADEASDAVESAVAEEAASADADAAMVSHEAAAVDDAQVVAEDAVARAALDPEALLSAETDDEAAAEAALVEDEEDFAAFRMSSSDNPEGLLEDVASAYASSLLSVGKSSSPTAKKSSVAQKFWGALTTIAPNAQADAASSGAICVVPQCLLPGGSKLAASAAATGAGCSCAAGYGSVSPWDLQAVAWAEALAAFTAASGKNLSSAKAGLVAGKNLTAAVSRLQQKQQSLWGFQPGSLSLPGLPLPWVSTNSSLWKWKANGTSAAVKVVRLPAVDVAAKKLAAASLASNASSLGKEAAAGLLATLKQCGKCPPGWASAGGVGAKCVKCPEEEVAGGGTCNKCAPGTGFSLKTGFCDPTGLYPTCPSCTCDPRTCSAAKAQCGAAPNGCSGSTPDCGTCSGALSCDLGSNLCSCAVGQSPPLNATSTALATSCVTVTGGACGQGSTCLSGRCAASSCVSSCPSGSSPAASTGACQCDATFYGAGGAAPCTACGGGSTSTAGSSTSCSCPAPSTWSSSTNACTCPNTLQSFVTGNCLGSPTAACTAGKECLSAECSSSVAGQCVSSCPPNSSDLSSTGLCSCNPGYFSSTGQAGCVKCGTGSTNGAYGSTSCSCSTPTGSVWNATTNSCACPAGTTNVNGNCLVSNGGGCSLFSQCASGICSAGQCVAQCPTGSAFSGADCVCQAGYYSGNGLSPCTACGGGSSNVGTFQSTCTCPVSAGSNPTWDSNTNSCSCPAGETFAIVGGTGLCRSNLGGPCGLDVNCVSGVCSGGTCSSTCAPNSSDRAGLCRCNPGYFDLLNGTPPCTACPAGSSSATAGFGSQGCVCATPSGSVWNAATNNCLCPSPTTQLVGGACLAVNGQPCVSGPGCSSGLCSAGKCVASCPAGSSDLGGGCQCNAGYFSVNVDGSTPCVACGGGSTSTTVGAGMCSCPLGSGATWDAATNACKCTDPNKGFVASSGTCLLKNNQLCAAGTDCVSGTCSSGVCVATCPVLTARDANGNCMCTANTFSNSNGQPPCTACPAGATSGVGATSCSCPAPFAWDPLTNTCACPSGTTLVNGQCLSVAGQLCSSGSQCASGLCANDSPRTGVDANVCVTSCPSPQSVATASGTCQCTIGSYGPGGFSPCQVCAGGSTTQAAGASECSCPAGSGATWSKAVNACLCPAGSVLVGSDCRKNDGEPCTAGLQCLSGECSSPSGGVCVSACPQGSSDGGGVCMCNPNFWSATGSPPGCTACPAGSTSVGWLTSCSCSQPLNSVFDAASNSCSCPAGTQLTPAGSTGACLLSAGQPCQGGADCSSGLCAATNSTGALTCVASCPSGSVPDGGGGCSCALGFFGGTTGKSPCTSCGGGSTTTSVGSSSCSCPATGGWDAAANACACPPGQAFSASTGACLNVNGRSCSTGADCVSNECSSPSGGSCTSSCSSFADASNYSPTQTCECNPNAYGPGGGPPCTLCVAGSSAPLVGSTSCSCQSPSGSTWDAATNTCLCPIGTQAVSGACLKANGQSCSAGSACASGICNAGLCVASCPSGTTASGGTCDCPPGQTKCSSGCVDLTTDPSSCGKCGNVCTQKFKYSTGNQCVQGICTVTGELTFTLTWDNGALLDFSVLLPCPARPTTSIEESRIMYYTGMSSQNSIVTDCGQGALDLFLLLATYVNGPRVAYFSPPAAGSYVFCVNPVTGGPANYTVKVTKNGAVVQVFTGTVAAGTPGNQPQLPGSATLPPCDPRNPFPGASTFTYVV